MADVCFSAESPCQRFNLAYNSTRWWLTLVLTLLALILFSAPLLYLSTFSYPPASTVGTGAVGPFLVISLLFLLLARLLFEVLPICNFDRWRYAVIVTILAMLIFSPFLNAIFYQLLGDSFWYGYLVQIIVYFLIVQLPFL